MELEPDTGRTETHEQIEWVGEQLRTKISAKFETSTFLAGFAATILSIQITLLWQETARPRLLPVSVALMIGAIVLFVMAMVKLDALTMPKRFWDEDSGINGADGSLRWFLTDSDLWELRKQMIFYWYRFTIAGIGTTSVSMICLLYPIRPVPRDISLVAKTGLSVMVVLVFVGIYLGAMSWDARRSFGKLVRPVD